MAANFVNSIKLLLIVFNFSECSELTVEVHNILITTPRSKLYVFSDLAIAKQINI